MSVQCFPSCSRVFHLYRELTIAGEERQILLFVSSSQTSIFHSYGDVTITVNGLQILTYGHRAGRDLYRAIPVMTSVYTVSSEGSQRLLTSYDTPGNLGPILTRVPTRRTQ